MCTKCRVADGQQFGYYHAQAIQFMDYSPKIGKFITTEPIPGSKFQPEDIVIDVPMGMELEVEFMDEYDEDAKEEAGYDSIYDLHDTMPCQIGSKHQPIIRKEDGSLHNGTEFVTQPMTLAAHKQINYELIKNWNFRGYYPSSTGLHIHLPKSYFSHRQLFIFLMLHRDLAIDDNLLDFVAKRGENMWAKRVFQYPETSYYNYRRAGKSLISQLAYYRHADSDRGPQRYSFVNLVPGPTIELRYFKSNLKQDSLMARLEYVNLIYTYTKLLSLHPLQSVIDFSTNYGLVDLLVVFAHMMEHKYPLFSKRLHNNDWGLDKTATKTNKSYADMVFDTESKLYLPTSKGGK